jgi:hypothetical protein
VVMVESANMACQLLGPPTRTCSAWLRTLYVIEQWRGGALEHEGGNLA